MIILYSFIEMNFQLQLGANKTTNFAELRVIHIKKQHTYIQKYIHTYIHTYIHIYIYTIYIHTYIHTYIQTDRLVTSKNSPSYLLSVKL